MTHMRQHFRCIKGCCICGTKSSTSRFTSSNNYEAYFGRCFLVEGRNGEICNACVLIVKRFMKNPNSGHDWHHIVDNGHNKKFRKKVSLRIRLQKNNTAENYDVNMLPIRAGSPPPSMFRTKKQEKKQEKYRHITKEERSEDDKFDSVWLHVTSSEGRSTFFPTHDPYPRISTLHQITPKQSSLCQPTPAESHDEHTFPNPAEVSCITQRYKLAHDAREQTIFQQSGKTTGVALTSPPRYPSPVGHHCYPTPATTPDLNTSSTSYAQSRPYCERCPVSPASCHGCEDASPYEEACSSYMSTSETSSDGTNPLSHLCQPMVLAPHSSSTLVRCPDAWQRAHSRAPMTTDESSCHSDSSQEMSAPCSLYNSPYPSPCPSDPVGVEEDGSLQCLSAIVADRPRLPVPTSWCGASRTSRLTCAAPKPAEGEARGSKRKQSAPKKGARTASLALDVVTSSPYWTQKKTCCGIVNVGRNSEILLMAGQYKPCPGGQHDAECTAALQRLSVNTTDAPTADTAPTTSSESREDSYEIMARDMAILHAHSTSTSATSTLVLPAPSSTANQVQPIVSSTTCSESHVQNYIESSTTANASSLASWNGSASLQEQSRTHQEHTRTHLTNSRTRNSGYRVVGTVYPDWDNYYDDDSEKPSSDEETYYSEVSQGRSMVTVDSLGALDLTKETGGWGMGPPAVVN